MIPVISIIIPVYNKEKYIRETLESILAQSYKNWELICVDDVSTDSSYEIVSSIKDDRISLIRNTKYNGANYCRNYGLAIAKGEFVMFVDADDLLLADCVSHRVNAIEKSNLDCCVFTLGTFYKQIGDSNSLWIPNSKQPLIDFLQHKLPWQTMQPIWRRNFLIDIGGFDETFQRLQDVELHTRALLSPKFKLKQVAGEPDCYFRIDEQRKNFKQYAFLEKWIRSSIQYYHKFYDKLPNKRLNRYVIGTIFKTYLQLFYSYKANTISKIEFDKLHDLFMEWLNLQSIGFKGKMSFKLARFFNLAPIKLPGINLLISKLIVL